MYHAGWLRCPHCEFRWQVCIETDGPLAADQSIFVRCPNDDSGHRYAMAQLQLVAECPAGVRPEKLARLTSSQRPTATRSAALGVVPLRQALALILLGAIGAATLIYVWWRFS